MTNEEKKVYMRDYMRKYRKNTENPTRGQLNYRKYVQMREVKIKQLSKHEKIITKYAAENKELKE